MRTTLLPRHFNLVVLWKYKEDNHLEIKIRLRPTTAVTMSKVEQKSCSPKSMHFQLVEMLTTNNSLNQKQKQKSLGLQYLHA